MPSPLHAIKFGSFENETPASVKKEEVVNTPPAELTVAVQQPPVQHHHGSERWMSVNQAPVPFPAPMYTSAPLVMFPGSELTRGEWDDRIAPKGYWNEQLRSEHSYYDAVAESIAQQIYEQGGEDLRKKPSGPAVPPVIVNVHNGKKVAELEKLRSDYAVVKARLDEIDEKFNTASSELNDTSKKLGDANEAIKKLQDGKTKGQKATQVAKKYATETIEWQEGEITRLKNAANAKQKAVEAQRTTHKEELQEKADELEALKKTIRELQAIAENTAPVLYDHYKQIKKAEEERDADIAAAQAERDAAIKERNQAFNDRDVAVSDASAARIETKKARDEAEKANDRADAAISKRQNVEIQLVSSMKAQKKAEQMVAGIRAKGTINLRDDFAEISRQFDERGQALTDAEHEVGKYKSQHHIFEQDRVQLMTLLGAMQNSLSAELAREPVGKIRAEWAHAAILAFAKEMEDLELYSADFNSGKKAIRLNGKNFEIVDPAADESITKSVNRLLRKADKRADGGSKVTTRDKSRNERFEMAAELDAMPTEDPEQ